MPVRRLAVATETFSGKRFSEFYNKSSSYQQIDPKELIYFLMLSTVEQSCWLTLLFPVDLPFFLDCFGILKVEQPMTSLVFQCAFPFCLKPYLNMKVPLRLRTALLRQGYM